MRVGLYIESRCSQHWRHRWHVPRKAHVRRQITNCDCSQVFFKIHGANRLQISRQTTHVNKRHFTGIWFRTAPMLGDLYVYNTSDRLYTAKLLRFFTIRCDTAVPVRTAVAGINQCLSCRRLQVLENIPTILTYLTVTHINDQSTTMPTENARANSE